jgi:hypothetical protein
LFAGELLLIQSRIVLINVADIGAVPSSGIWKPQTGTAWEILLKR